MKLNQLRTTLAASLALAATAAQAQQVVNLTPTSNINAVLLTLKPGDTLKLTGTFETAVRFTKRDFGGVTLDARGAILREGLLMQDVRNLNIVGGTFGRTDADTREWATLGIANSAHISVSGTTVVGNGNMRGAGIKVTGSQFVTIRDNRLSGHLGSIMLASSVDSLITRNVMTAAASDGIQIVDSHRVIAASNKCSDFTPGLGAHPDCIQLWSVADKPLQSDIFILNNSAIGNMQAYLSSDPKTGSGTQLTFAGNYAAVTYTHSVTCGNCTNSVFFNNVLSNLPNAVHGAPSLKIGPSPTNVVGYNPLYDLRGRTDGWLPDPLWTSFQPDIAGQVGSKWDDRSFGFRSANELGAAVPEPANWLMMGLGFALVGMSRRRRPQLVLA
ncbi:NosD domain-containing protein [Sandarakinorhabdus oryzae]|uniref:NosD domain-containing protein n=1 Tax=Sandarakinorhabdus oryzae TaxID=2675220 RepID=UPI0018CC74E9|nr:NosD domain-containing protein [Sandarakinorhabdus oryzae]